MTMISAETYARSKGVNARTVATWFKKGYLPHATQDATTKGYSIPEDTPRPYKGDGNVKKITSLILKLLDAANLQQAVFPSMFPKMASGTVDRTIEDLVDSGLIRIQLTHSGDQFLELTQVGMEFMATPAAKRNKVISAIGQSLSRGIEALAAVVTIATAV